MPGVLMETNSPSKNMPKVGMVQLEINSKAEPVQLTLLPDMLVLEKEELAYTTSPNSAHLENANLNKERMVVLKKEKVGGLGLSVKGGAEHQLPIIVSRIFKDQAADRTGQLYVGDAILKVDGEDINEMTHDEAVQCLKNTGETVKLTVTYYRPASIFLTSKQQTASSGSAQNSSDPSSASMGPAVPQWNTLSKIPLLWAYVTKYVPFDDQPRTSSFAVVSMDKVSTGILQCESFEEAREWMNAINSTINSLNSQSITLTNKSLPTDQKVHYMCWAGLRSQTKTSEITWEPMFLCLKGCEVSLFEGPPVKTKDEVICRDVGVLYESMLKVLRDVEGSRPDCVALELSGGNQVYYLGLEDRQQLLALEKNWYRCNYLLLMQLQKKTYECTWRGQPSELELSVENGLTLVTKNDQCSPWAYRFSQFKGSSDDGHNLLRLHFLNETSQSLEMREIESNKMNTLLFAMHAFFAAKLASVDPEFLLPWS